MSYRRILALLLTWTVLVLVANRLVASPRLLFDPPVVAYVAVVTLLAGLASTGPRGLVSALGDALSRDAADLPEERRRVGASTLRSLGGAAVAAGLLGFFGVLIATFNGIVSTSGQASPHDVFLGLPAMVIAPLYGMALKAFLFDALAEGLEGSEPGLGAEL